MPVTRELALTYGSFTVGTGTGTQIRGPLRIKRTRRRAEVSFQLVLTGAQPPTAATDFLGKEAALLAAFNMPRQNLAVTLSANNRFLLTEGSTALGVESECEKAGTIPGDTGRSAVYDVFISSGLPEPLSALAGRAELSWTVEYDAAVRGTLTVEGHYLRTGSGTGSRAAYAAGFPARLAAILSLLGGSWEQVEEWAKTDDFDDRTDFRARLRERLTDQSTAGLDHPDLAETTLDVTREVEAPGDDPSSGARRLIRLAGLYSAAVRSTGSITLDEAVTIATTLMLVRMQEVAGGQVAILRVRPAFDREGSRLRVDFEGVSTANGSLVSSRTTTRDRLETRTAINETWATPGDIESMTPPDAYVFRSPCLIERTVTVVETVVGDADIPGPPLPKPRAGGSPMGVFGIGGRINLDFGPQGIFTIGSKLSLQFLTPEQAAAERGGGAGAASAVVGAGEVRWVLVSIAPEWTAQKVGLDELGSPIVLTDRVRSTTWRLVRGAKPPASSGGSGSGTRERGRGETPQTSGRGRGPEPARPGGPA